MALYISHLYLCIRKFSVKNFLQEVPQKSCGAKLITLTNQPDPRPPPTSGAYSQSNVFSPQPVENIDGYQSGWNF